VKLVKMALLLGTYLWQLAMFSQNQ